MAKIESTDYLLFFGVLTLGAGATQDEETSLEQISRQKNSGTNWVSTRDVPLNRRNGWRMSGTARTLWRYGVTVK